MSKRDPMEVLIADALDRAGIGYLSGSNNPSELDFALSNGVEIEVKAFHSPRIAAQMARADHAIAAQGEKAVRFLARLIDEASENNRRLADHSFLLAVIGDIREKSGVGAGPMLNELADAIAARIRGVEAERDKAICRAAAQEDRAERAERERDEARHDENMGDHNRTMTRAEAAEARIARLVEQLRPFVRTNEDSSFVAPRDADLNHLLNWAEAAVATALPEWIADFLNRRTEVEHVLRAPAMARKKGQPEPAPLTPEEMLALADKLSVPSEFMGSTPTEVRQAPNFEAAQAIYLRGRTMSGEEHKAIIDDGAEAAPMALPVGARVVKSQGYAFPGEVRAAFTNRTGELRYVVEATGADYAGMLHIFNPQQLALLYGERSNDT